MNDKTANIMHSQELSKRRRLKAQGEHHPDKIAADDAQVNPLPATEGMDRILKATQTENYYLRRLLKTRERDRRMVAYDSRANSQQPEDDDDSFPTQGGRREQRGEPEERGGIREFLGNLFDFG